MQAFRWHSKARLFGPAGEEHPRAARFAALPSPDPAPAALAAILSGPAGAAFRIGGEGPLQAGPGQFETLTGGSLGPPRRVIRSHASWCASFAVNAGLFDIGPGTRVATPGALVHSLSLYAAIEALHLGADLHLLAGLRPDRQAAAIAGQGAQVLYATPAQLRAILATPIPQPSLRHVVIGGARLDASLRQAIADAAPQARLHEFYGAAEASFITLASTSEAGETVGQPYPGVSLRLDDQGLIWVKSPYLFAGYAGDDPGSARWQDGWLTVGEMGEMTPAGLILRGRAGRMVTVADRNVFPEEIEALLVTLPGVQRAAILPLPDSARGHVLIAVLQGDARKEPAITAALRERLGPMLAPRRIDWRADWPILPSGKTDLSRLLAEVAPWR